MALAAQECLGENLERGFLITKDQHLGESPGTFQRFTLREASHPVPNRAGVEATRELLGWLESPSPSTQALVLLSGGASSLLVAPTPPLGLKDLGHLNTQLLRSGLPIEKMNVLRKHLSRVKGGQLSEHFANYQNLMQLVMVDICAPQLAEHEVLSMVGSGPCCADPTTMGQAGEILEALRPNLPEELARKTEAALAETPKQTRFESLVVADYRTLAAVARELLGPSATQHPDWKSEVLGEVRQVAAEFAAVARDMKERGQRGVLIASGEPTVEIGAERPGRGGRCQELALWFAREVAGLEGVELLAGSSDGTDGPTHDAGAQVDGETWPRLAEQVGRETAEAMLRGHDSGSALAKLPGALLTIGPTGQNLNDLYLLKVE